MKLVRTVIVPFVALWFQLLTSVVSADVMEFVAARDNTLYEDAAGTLSNGAGDFFFAGTNGGGQLRRGLIAFELSSLPAGARIHSVSVTLFMSQSSAGPETIGLHRLENDWGESTSDANGGEGGGATAVDGDATWIHTFFPGSFWNSPGGDFIVAASASQTVAGVGSYSWTSAGLLNDVQGWLDGGFENFGWAIVGNEIDFPSAKRFNTRENDQGRPILSVDFTVVPEPTTPGVLLILGTLLLTRRRRCPSTTQTESGSRVLAGKFPADCAGC